MAATGIVQSTSRSMSQPAECAFEKRALIPAWPLLGRLISSRVRMASPYRRD
jgi:hypothetical protein